MSVSDAATRNAAAVTSKTGANESSRNLRNGPSILIARKISGDGFGWTFPLLFDMGEG